MKTIQILIVIGCIAISSVGIAQDAVVVRTDRREVITFGVKAGLNYSNIYNSQTEEFRADAKFGFAGGLFLGIPIGTFLGVQPEILISQKGFKGKGMFLGSEYSFTRTTTFIDVPLLVSLKPSEFLTILAGPQYSYLIKQRDDYNSTFLTTSQEQEFNDYNIRDNIFGFIAGLDVNFDQLVVGARVGWDLTTNHGDGSSSNPRYKNTWVQATVGYTF